MGIEKQLKPTLVTEAAPEEDPGDEQGAPSSASSGRSPARKRQRAFSASPNIPRQHLTEPVVGELVQVPPGHLQADAAARAANSVLRQRRAAVAVLEELERLDHQLLPRLDPRVEALR